MAASSGKRGGGRKKAPTAEERLSSSLLTLAKTRSELNRAELRATRAEDALKLTQEQLAEQVERTESAKLVAQRVREEQSSTLREHLAKYEARLKELSKAATEGHEQALKLHTERAALLERVAAAESQRDKLQAMADAERNLREKLEELQSQASGRLEDFISKSKPLIDENKRLSESNAELAKANVALHQRLKDAAEQQSESLRLLSESRTAIRRLEQSREKDARARKELLRRVEKAETLAAGALKESVSDKKELTRLLKQDRQSTRLVALLQARVTDLEARPMPAAVRAADPAAGGASTKRTERADSIAESAASGSPSGAEAGGSALAAGGALGAADGEDGAAGEGARAADEGVPGGSGSSAETNA